LPLADDEAPRLLWLALSLSAAFSSDLSDGRRSLRSSEPARPRLA
jgi:hypothetical protein